MVASLSKRGVTAMPVFLVKASSICLEKIASSDFDLLVTDFMLPGITGGEVVRRVKSIRPDMPVVLFSVFYDDVTTISPEVRRSADACLKKPLDHDEFVRVVAELLGDDTFADASRDAR